MSCFFLASDGIGKTEVSSSLGVSGESVRKSEQIFAFLPLLSTIVKGRIVGHRVYREKECVGELQT